MRLSYSLVCKRPALLHRLTGLSVGEFEHLCEEFASQYHRLVIQPRVRAEHRVRALGGGQKGALPEIADKLFFILLYTRIYPLLIVQGLFFGIAESKACKWVGMLLPVLDASLGSAHVRPKRAKGQSLEEIIEAFPDLQELGVLIDGTERPIRRPKEPTKQQEDYSGKKKRHTRKHLTITHPQTQYILATSEEASGSTHDKKMLDESDLSCKEALPIGADSGFQGLELGKAVVVTPIKRKRKKKGEPKDELTPAQKESNTELAKARISIEHSNAGLKRNRSVADILRNTRAGMSDQLMLVAMGLHNLRVTMRTSYQHSGT
jgi:DDE superfamily endonuclease/Helix-turn-helix of DDE superfamily endonuclease